ncbi:esterase/lipase family protein [Nitrosomonas supralitoralis]|uniref:GPI inositol-deacylase PGAP1-like alpha/beta domain-containing protein n=1 Tax=Nitrosomonas supralitoralis TaxID=2116706 RepID=A0A2P7NRG1_9PROT|nr:hypothetical protein [Nitrosomonas supralitoralis]PSJ16027.1 hypothetical protein C7H79_15765 [Nitrosomonas supralitoralis]
MNSQQRKGYSVSASTTLRLIILMLICNTAVTIYSPVQAANTEPPLKNIECLFNWAQTFYPELFSPLVSSAEFSSPYTYRYFPTTNAYLGVSSVDNHVYYKGPDSSLQDVGDLSTWLKMSGCGEKLYPVIFIHGLASSADTWKSYRNYLINNGNSIFGGNPVYNYATKSVEIQCPTDLSSLDFCTGSAGDFYSLNFSNSQGLSLDVQGGELSVIIEAVLAANPDKTKVILVSHSSGGLIAREYLQGLARVSDSVTRIPYREDVAKLMMIGTPHQGSFWAEQCRNQFDILNFSGDVGICALLSLDIDPESTAVKELKPDSEALNILNDLNTYPLPSNVSYVSIIGTGQPTLVSLVDSDDGDGIVSRISQDLMTVAGNLLPLHESVNIDIAFQECGNNLDVPFVGKIGETHTCETTDISVGAKILSNLQ